MGAVEWSASAAPPPPGQGYGAYERTVADLPDVRDVLLDDDGTVIAALGAGGVVRIQPDGQRGTLVPWWPAGQVAYAASLAKAPDGSVLVGDLQRPQVVSIAPSGARTVFADLTQLASPPRPAALAVMADRVLLADSGLPRVVVLDTGGQAQAEGPIETPADGVRPVLRGLVAGGGHVFVADAANHRIVRLDPQTGQATLAWGDRGVFPGMFESPAGLAWDGSALLVTDTLNHRVVRFDAQGTMLDQWGMHAVRPREGNGKIHYPVASAVSPDGQRVVVAEPFERRAQVFTALPPVDPAAPRATPLPANEGVASHFGRELAIDGQTLLVFEPESAAALVFDMRPELPIHVTTIGGPGRVPGKFGQVSTLLVDEKANRLFLADPVRGVIAVYTLRRDGQSPRFDPFMARLVSELALDPIAQFAAQRAGGPAALWPVDMRRSPSGGFVLLDGLAQRVIELDSNLRPVNAWSSKKGPGLLVGPTQLAVLPQGDVVVVDSSDRTLKRFGLANGDFKAEHALHELKRPWGIALVGEGAAMRYAVTDTAGDGMLLLHPETGLVEKRTGERGGKPGDLWEPGAIEVSPRDGRLYLVDYGNHRLQSFQPDGTWESSFGLGRPYVRPRDPNAPQRPVIPMGVAPSAEGAANTLAQFSPPRKLDDGWWQVSSADGRYRVEYRLLPEKVPLRDPFSMEVKVTDTLTSQPSEARLQVDAGMPHHHHGMNVLPRVTGTGPGQWKVENMMFHMPGYWEIMFDLTEGGRLERAQTEVELE